MTKFDVHFQPVNISDASDYTARPDPLGRQPPITHQVHSFEAKDKTVNPLNSPMRNHKHPFLVKLRFPSTFNKYSQFS